MFSSLDKKLRLTLKHSTILTLIALICLVVLSTFLVLTNQTQNWFKVFHQTYPIIAFIITPIGIVSTVYIIKTFCQATASNGILQIFVTIKNKQLTRLLSVRVALQKIALLFIVSATGGSIGVGSPSIHLGACLFYGIYRRLSAIKEAHIHTVITTGSSVGLMIVFDAPIAAVLLIYEALGKHINKQTLLIAAVITITLHLVLQYLIGNTPYHLGNYSAYTFDSVLTWQLIPIALIASIFGAVFNKTTLYMMKIMTNYEHPKLLLIAVILGFIIACVNMVSNGMTAGSGYAEAQAMLNLTLSDNYFAPLKYIATLASFASAVPGGIFMPSLSIGAGLGVELSYFYSHITPQVIMIMAMVCYLSAIIRLPLTSAFLVMEMTENYQLIIPVLLLAYLSSFLSAKLYPPRLYEELLKDYKLPPNIQY